MHGKRPSFIYSSHLDYMYRSWRSDVYLCACREVKDNSHESTTKTSEKSSTVCAYEKLQYLQTVSTICESVHVDMQRLTLGNLITLACFCIQSQLPQLMIQWRIPGSAALNLPYKPAAQQWYHCRQYIPSGMRLTSLLLVGDAQWLQDSQLLCHCLPLRSSIC